MTPGRAGAVTLGNTPAPARDQVYGRSRAWPAAGQGSGPGSGPGQRVADPGGDPALPGHEQGVTGAMMVSPKAGGMVAGPVQVRDPCRPGPLLLGHVVGPARLPRHRLAVRRHPGQPVHRLVQRLRHGRRIGSRIPPAGMTPARLFPPKITLCSGHSWLARVARPSQPARHRLDAGLLSHHHFRPIGGPRPQPSRLAPLIPDLVQIKRTFSHRKRTKSGISARKPGGTSRVALLMRHLGRLRTASRGRGVRGAGRDRRGGRGCGVRGVTGGVGAVAGCGA